MGLKGRKNGPNDVRKSWRGECDQWYAIELVKHILDIENRSKLARYKGGPEPANKIQRTPGCF